MKLILTIWMYEDIIQISLSAITKISNDIWWFLLFTNRRNHKIFFFEFNKTCAFRTPLFLLSLTIINWNRVIVKMWCKLNSLITNYQHILYHDQRKLAFGTFLATFQDMPSLYLPEWSVLWTFSPWNYLISSMWNPFWSKVRSEIQYL